MYVCTDNVIHLNNIDGIQSSWIPKAKQECMLNASDNYLLKEVTGVFQRRISI